jgi:hypothetical protein
MDTQRTWQARVIAAAPLIFAILWGGLLNTGVVQLFGRQSLEVTRRDWRRGYYLGDLDLASAAREKLVGLEAPQPRRNNS